MSAHEQIMAGVTVTITIPAYCTTTELWEILMAAYDKELDRILVENPAPITDPARLLGPGVAGEPHNESEITPGNFTSAENEETEEL